MRCEAATEQADQVMASIPERARERIRLNPAWRDQNRTVVGDWLGATA